MFLMLGADYMEIFSPGWNFNSLNRVEISFRLNNKLLFKITLQLHVEISIRYNELKFQFALAKPRLNFNPGWKFQVFQIINISSNPEWKFESTNERIPCLFFKKLKMANSRVRFKWVNDKLVNLTKPLQEFKSYM